MRNVLLKEVLHLPELINGKVCIIENGRYSLLNPSRYTIIEEGFDPMDYAILDTPKYHKCIIYSSNSEKAHYLVNVKYREMLVNANRIPTLYRVSDKIHIHSRRGIYEIVSIKSNTIEITCNKWQYTSQKSIIITKDDFKCLAGGLHNYAE